LNCYQGYEACKTAFIMYRKKASATRITIPRLELVP